MSVVCEEVFDEKSHPSIEEIRDYALKIGIDPNEEPQLLPIAAEGLMKALPAAWKPCFDEKSKAFYYYNRKTGKTQWEHPLDNIYKDMVKKARADSQSISLGEPTDDTTYIRDDLPSYEETPLISTNLFMPKKLEPLLPTVKQNQSAKLLRRSPTVDLNSSPRHEMQFVKQKSFDHIFVDKKLSLGNEQFDIFEKHPKMFDSKPELKVNGGGSMFLKTNTKKPETDQKSAQHKNDDSIVKKPNVEEKEPTESPSSKDIKNNPNGDEEVEKKGVRFITQQETQFEFSDKSDDDEEEFGDDVDDDDEDEVQKDEINPVLQISFAPQNKTKSPFTLAMQDEVVTKPPLPNRNLKLVKPNLTDFIKPSLIKTRSSDSDDDSPNGKIKRITLAEIDLDSDNDSPDSPNERITKKTLELERKMEERVEKLKNKMWKSKNEELVQFQENLEDSQREELKRIMNRENEIHEQKRNEEIEKLKAEIEEKHQKMLENERKKLEESLVTSEINLKKRIEKEEAELKKNYETKREELEKYYEDKLVEIETNLAENMEKSRDELITSHNVILDQLKQSNAAIIEELKEELKKEEETIRNEHKIKLEKLSPKELENEETGSRYDHDEKYEKLRCEKRLLSDKYKCLKEKYLKLKSDVRLTIEKRNKKKEEGKSCATTGSDGSYSTNKDRTPMQSPSKKKPPTPKLPKTKTDQHGPKESNSLNDIDISMSDRSEDQTNKNDYDTSENSTSHGRTRKKSFARIKSSTVKASGSKYHPGERPCSPVENLRKQLQKLEDLEDQFPQHQSDTYHLRYPFSDGNKFEGSSELEFFRHRIHLERDSIKRAKESLRSQKTQFQQRQKELKLKHGSMARHTYQQLCQRATVTKEAKFEDATLSDLSSHSGSSGISSTEIQDAQLLGRAGLLDDEPSEIIQSLESLNSEIKEIWEVLRKQQQQAGNITAVIPPFIYPDLGWPILAGSAPPSIPTLADRLNNYRQHIALANAQSTMVTHAANQGATTTLVERTRNLKHWLKQAGVENPENGKPQANL